MEQSFSVRKFRNFGYRSQALNLLFQVLETVKKAAFIRQWKFP